MQVSKSNRSIASKPLVQSFTELRPEIPWTGSIHYILSTRWFQRIWVVQEATLPKHLLVQIGRQTLAWDIFVSVALRFLSNLKAGDAINANLDVCYSVCKDKVFDMAVQKELSMINVIANLRRWLHMPCDIPIPASQLVYLCRDRQATQDVDKVYALHGQHSDIKGFCRRLRGPTTLRSSMVSTHRNTAGSRASVLTAA